MSEDPARARPVLERVAPLLLVLGGLLVLGHQQGRFAFYEDEGINLLKALMVARGHPLYAEIYSDQAPLFTWVLALALRIVGPEFEHLQIVSLVFGMGLLVGAAAVAREIAGMAAGVVCAVFLLACAPFLKFATSVLITTPALALAVWSLYFALLSRRTRSRKVVLASGSLLGLAAITKLAALYLLPVVVAALLLNPPATERPRRATSVALLLAALATPLLAVLLACPVTELLAQLIDPHVAGFQVAAKQAGRMRAIILLAPGMIATYAAAVLGTAVLVRLVPRTATVLALWLLEAATVMLLHRPLWHHHLPELLVPMAVAGAAGAISAARAPRMPARWRQALALLPAAVLVVAAAAQVRAHSYWRGAYDSASLTSLRQVAAELERATAAEDWVIVDRPSLAFFARRRVPPQLVLVVQKRMASGDLTDREFLNALARYRPAAVVLCTSLTRPFEAFGVALEGYSVGPPLPLLSEFGRKKLAPCYIHRRPESERR